MFVSIFHVCWTAVLGGKFYSILSCIVLVMTPKLISLLIVWWGTARDPLVNTGDSSYCFTNISLYEKPRCKLTKQLLFSYDFTGDTAAYAGIVWPSTEIMEARNPPQGVGCRCVYKKYCSCT